MTKKALPALLLAVAVAAPLAAQETKPAEDATVPAEERPEPTRKIRVLQHPYDIAKFYRSSQSRPFEIDVEPSLGSPFDNPYAIAGYYRNSSSRPSAYGYSQFWSLGYSRRGRVSPVVGRRMGRNGDLFLFAPTVLAPIGPLNGLFFAEGR
jgi:hypothetical protein